MFGPPARQGDAFVIAQSLDLRSGFHAAVRGDLLKDAKAQSPEEEAIKGQLAEEVERAMEPMSDREKEILRLRYGLGTDREYTLEEIGRRLSLTRERVRQIEAGAVAKMRKSKGRAA